MTDVVVRAVSPDQHEAVMHYFDMVAYADNPNWSKCFCMERLAEDFDSRTKQQNRASRSQLILSAKANGLVAYRLGRVVGWCHAAPKTELVNIEGEKAPEVGAIVCLTEQFEIRLKSSEYAEALDAGTVPCSVVPFEIREGGVARIG